jgi:hypothetical protein
MAAFTPLEHAALVAILAEGPKDRAVIERQLLHSNVVSRQNTGGGFFADLKVDLAAGAIEKKTAALGENVWIGIDGLELGLGMILHFKDGRASLLEGYAVGPEDTSAVDFAHARYAVLPEPGPLPVNGT